MPFNPPPVYIINETTHRARQHVIAGAIITFIYAHDPGWGLNQWGSAEINGSAHSVLYDGASGTWGSLDISSLLHWGEKNDIHLSIWHGYNLATGNPPFGVFLNFQLDPNYWDPGGYVFRASAAGTYPSVMVEGPFENCDWRFPITLINA